MRLLLRNEYISIFVLNKKCKNYSKKILEENLKKHIEMKQRAFKSSEEDKMEPSESEKSWQRV